MHLRHSPQWRDGRGGRAIYSTGPRRGVVAPGMSRGSGVGDQGSASSLASCALRLTPLPRLWWSGPWQKRGRAIYSTGLHSRTRNKIGVVRPPGKGRAPAAGGVTGDGRVRGGSRCALFRRSPCLRRQRCRVGNARQVGRVSRFRSAIAGLRRASRARQITL